MKFFLQSLRTSSVGSHSPPSGLSRIWASAARHLWHYFFHFWSMVQTLLRSPIVRSPWSFSTSPSLGRSRVAPLPPVAETLNYFISKDKKFANQFQAREKFNFSIWNEYCRFNSLFLSWWCNPTSYEVWKRGEIPGWPTVGYTPRSVPGIKNWS